MPGSSAVILWTDLGPIQTQYQTPEIPRPDRQLCDLPPLTLLCSDRVFMQSRSGAENPLRAFSELFDGVKGMANGLSRIAIGRDGAAAWECYPVPALSGGSCRHRRLGLAARVMPGIVTAVRSRINQHAFDR